MNALKRVEKAIMECAYYDVREEQSLEHAWGDVRDAIEQARAEGFAAGRLDAMRVVHFFCDHAQDDAYAEQGYYNDARYWDGRGAAFGDVMRHTENILQTLTPREGA